MATPFDLVGGSLVVDEYKGDYAAALSVVERLVADAEQAEDVRVLARALLAGAMVQLLAGNSGAALRTLDHLFSLDPEWQLLTKAWVYGWHANHLRGRALIDTASGVWSQTDVFLLWRMDSMDFGEENGFEPEFRDWLLGGERFGTWGEPGWEEPDFGVPDGLVTLGLQYTRQLHCAVEAAELRGAEPHQEQLRQLAGANADEDLEESAAQLEHNDHANWALLHRARAEQARRMGDHTTAVERVADALARYRAAGDNTGIASLELLVGDWLAAPGSSPLLLGMLANSAPGTELARLRASPAPRVVAEVERRYAAAFEMFAEQPRGQAAVTLRRGYLASLRGDHDEAECRADEAADQFGEHGDSHHEVVAVMHATLYRIAAGGHPDDNLVDVLGGWAEDSGSPGLVCNLGKLADAWGRHLLHDLGDPHGALRCHELAARVQHRIGVPTAESASHAAMRDVYVCIGEEQRAARCAEEALTALTPVLRPDHPLLFPALNAIPELLVNGLYFRYVTAMDGDGLAAAAERLRPFRDRYVDLLAGHEPVRYEDLLRTATDETDWPDSGILGTARVYEPVLDYLIEQAEKFVPYLRAVRRRSEGHVADADAELERLLARYRGEATPTAREIEPFLLLALKRDDDAVTAYERVVADFGAPPLGLFFSLLRQSGGPPVRGERSSLAFSQLAMYAWAHHFEKAAAAARELARLDGADWWRHAGFESFDAVSYLAMIAEGLGRLDEAAGWYRIAIEGVEHQLSGSGRNTWQTSFYGSGKAAACYTAASRCAIRRHIRTPGAMLDVESFELSERGRARATRDLFALGENSRDPLLRGWREADARATVRHNQLHSAKAGTADTARLAELERAVSEADQRLAEIECELAERSPLLAGFPPRDDRAGLVARIAATLPHDTAMLAYRIHEDSLLVWAITCRGLVLARERVVAPGFTERVRLLFEACDELAGDWSPHAAELAGILLNPVAPVLRDHTRLLLVPSQAIHRVPLHALPWAGEPLVASHEITYLPAATGISGAHRAHRPLVTFGDPAAMRYDDGTIAEALPKARQEAETIAARFAGTAHVGPAVTRDAVLAALATPGVVHLASHGEFDASAPLNSAVLLAGGDRLTAADLMGAEVRADVVVLSACSTAAGAITHGEDVIGLPRALLAGGAGAVVATLWGAYEGPTAQLVGELHRRLHDGQPVAAALRAAQNAMRCGEFGRRARHPGCWAPLIVIGRH